VHGISNDAYELLAAACVRATSSALKPAGEPTAPGDFPSRLPEIAEGFNLEALGEESSIATTLPWPSRSRGACRPRRRRRSG
jgi:hypothetical protein